MTPLILMLFGFFGLPEIGSTDPKIVRAEFDALDKWERSRRAKKKAKKRGRFR